MTKALTYVELDVDFCSLSYGVGACPAVLGVDSEQKCFNTIATCPVRASFDNAPVTLRFAVPTSYLPQDIEAIPSLVSYSYSPAVVSLGENLGERASLTLTFRDHKHSDAGTGYDPYVTERAYNPWEQGSYWGKFRARQPYLRGRAIRLIRGELGQALEDMATQHFVVESFSGPTPDGLYTIVAKDILKLADGDRAQAPALSNGVLLSGISNSATSATLSPSGIGDAEYPASGYVAIGGKEVCAFTRSGDALTLTRAQFNTTAVAHAAEDRVQLCLQYSAEDPADIINDLLVTYAGVPADYIPLADWQNETASYLQRVYTALIAEPTSVNTLISELVEQAALAIWWDEVNRKIRLQVLRAIVTTADTFSEESIMQGSLSLAEQPDKRISQVWTYYGKRNPLEKHTEADNYRSCAITVDADAEADYGAPAIKKIFSRWIPAFGRTVALRVNDIQLGRYRDPPRAFQFSLFRDGDTVPVLGAGYQLMAWPLQDEFGAAATVPIQITRLSPESAQYVLAAEEALFQQFDSDFLQTRTITIDANTLDFNLRTVHDSIYPEITSYDLTSPAVELVCIVESGVIVGASTTAGPAFDVGEWPVGFVPTIILRGRIEGAGGRGGDGAQVSGAQPGFPGGTALYTRNDVVVEIDGGEIWGGGGGGGGAQSPTTSSTANGGGGGGGYVPGVYGATVGGTSHASNGTTEAGGAGFFRSGAGGDPGEDGEPSNNAGGWGLLAGGAAGNAIDGVSYCTITGSPADIRGPQVN